MRYQQLSELQAMQRAQAFLDDNASVLGAVNKSRFRTALDEVVTGLTGNHVKQFAARDTSLSRTAYRDRLQDTLRLLHMQPVAEIARSRLVAATDISEMRSPQKGLSAPSLVNAARVMASTAEQYKQVFLEEQLPEDFLEQLRAAADAVEKATLMRDASRKAQVGATAGVNAQISRGRLVMRVLNAMVVSQLLQQPELLRQWRFVKHVVRKPGVPRGTTVATPTVVAPEPTPTPAPAAPTAPALVVSPQTPAEHGQPEGGELAAAA